MKYYVVEWDKNTWDEEGSECTHEERYVIVSEEDFKEVLEDFGFKDKHEIPNRPATKADFKKYEVVDSEWFVYN